jgi:hypothetical protein
VRYAVVLAVFTFMALTPLTARGQSNVGCRGECVGNGNARDGRECFNTVEAQTLDQLIPVMTGNGTSCPEQRPIVGARVVQLTDGCNRIDVFYCPTAVSGLGEGLRVDRQPNECFSATEASDLDTLRLAIQANGTSCPAAFPVMGGVKLQESNGCWRAPSVYCQSLGGTASQLLANAGFEEDQPPALSAPGWVSDSFRQLAAKSETNQPHTGTKNGACWSTSNLDCGMYQDVTAPITGEFTFTIYANADKSTGLVGVNVNGLGVAAATVIARGFGSYGAAYTMTFSAVQGDMIRVWMYSPASPGYVVIDDASLTTTF